jgi:hypothetical protein
VFYPVVAVLTDDFLVSRSTELELLRFDLPTQEVRSLGQRLVDNKKAKRPLCELVMGVGDRIATLKLADSMLKASFA